MRHCPFTTGGLAITAVIAMLAGCSVGGKARDGVVAATLSKGRQEIGRAHV